MNYVVHLFLFALLFLVNSTFKYLPILKTGFLLLLNFQSSLYILNISPLLYICFKDIFSQYVASPFIL